MKLNLIFPKHKIMHELHFFRKSNYPIITNAILFYGRVAFLWFLLCQDLVYNNPLGKQQRIVALREILYIPYIYREQ